MKKIIYTIALIISAIPAMAFAALPAGFEFQTMATGLNLPTAMSFTTDGRIFIAEKDGTVKLFKNGILQITPVIKITDINTYGDRGLLGIATDPNFLTNGYLYLLYTKENTPGFNVAGPKVGSLVRVTVIGDTASEASKVIILGTIFGNVSSPSCTNFATSSDCIPSDSLSHSVGGLRFGPDNKLYVTLGDGSSFDYADPKSLRSQDINSLAGKLLRINTDGTGAIDNPFYDGNVNSNRSKVYSYGLRNSFRFNFRPSNGKLFFGDVGWNKFEELNIAAPGGNYGWPCREGATTTPGWVGCSLSGAYTDPLYFYPHDINGAGSITAGSFTSSSVYPNTFTNSYLFGDYAQNFIKKIDFDANNQVLGVSDFATGADGTDGPVEFATGPDGYVYFLGIYTGSLKKINYTLSNRQPNAVIQSSVNSGTLPLSVNFNAASSSDPDSDPLTFFWNFGNGASSTKATTTYVYTAAGTYNVFLTVFDGRGGSNTKSLTVYAGNQAPSVSIVSPSSGSLYSPNASVQLQGTATDPESGALIGNSLTWRIILHHNTHTHIIQTLTGNSPVFIAPDHNDPDVYIEVELKATDPLGASKTTTINMYLNNNAQATGNLILNPSFANAQSGNPNNPESWYKGGYGLNDALFTYPVAGQDGNSAAKLQMISIVDGDAKWLFSPVYITPGLEYRYSNYYTASSTSHLTAQFSYANGNYSYKDYGDFPATSTWAKIERVFTPPAGANTVTFFHSLRQVGVLTTDNFNLSLNIATTSSTSTPPIVSTSSSIINLIKNPGVNLFATSTPSKPLNWSTGKFGNNATTFTYPTTGISGNAVDVSMTSYVSGDAKWIFDDVDVIPSKTYNLSWNYKSSTSTAVYLRYKTASSTFLYSTLSPKMASSSSWKKTEFTFTVPVNVTSVTAFQSLFRVGTLSTDDYSLSLVDNVPPVVNIISPIQNQTATGTFNFQVNATDTNAVESVNLFIDTISRGILNVLPYNFQIDTNTLANATHTAFAVARDTSGNIATSSSIIFNVNNQQGSGTTTATSTLTNLILNSSFENQTGLYPSNWNISGFGNNTRTFNYPIVGPDGNKAAGLTVSNYVDGDAKWRHDDVLVSPGTLYRYDTKYKSNVISDIIGRYTMNDNSELYFGLKKEIQPIETWSFATATFTPPTNVKSVSLFHLISANGYLNLDDTGLFVVGSTTVNTDVQPPVVDFIFPLASSTVSDIINIRASSSDNVAVTYVIFAVDGIVISPQITTSPYSFNWDTRSVPNGSHILKATTHDAAGNNTATNIPFIVNNSTTTNLVLNPSFEISDVNNNPQSWQKGGYGTNDRNFSYPVAGNTGLKAVQIDVNNYTDGDAKWIFDPISVASNTLYTFSSYYKSTATTTLTVRYTLNDGSFVYAGIANLNPSANWKQTVIALNTPINTSQLTVFQSISSTGTLILDDYSVIPGNIDTDTFNRGMVSLTFDDGWSSHFTSALPILNNANLKGSFEIISLETLGTLPDNRVPNFSLESADTNGPVDWFKGNWGTNTATFTYPVAGYTGGSAAKVEMSNYVDGDAKWFFKDSSVVDGQLSEFYDYYMSDATTTITARYNMGSSTYVYAELATLPPASTWTLFVKQFSIPANVESFTIFHRLASNGYLTIDNMSFSNVRDFVNPNQVLQIQAAGHEIGSHSQTHPSLSNIPQDRMVAEVTNSKSDLLNMGVSNVDVIVYPYGDYNASVVQAAANAGYIGGRSVNRGYNTKSTNKYELKIQQIDLTTSVDQIKSWIDIAESTKTWLILMFHQVDTNGDALSITPTNMQSIVNYLVQKNTLVTSMKGGILQMNP